MTELILFHHAQGLTDGVRAFADELRGAGHVVHVPDPGFSLGVLPAQMLAQTGAGASGALLFNGCIPPSEFGSPWPQGVPVQIHMMDGDEWVLPPNEDLEAARGLAETVDGAELFSIPAIGTCSPTAACPATTRAPRRCSSSGRSPSSTPSGSPSA